MEELLGGSPYVFIGLTCILMGFCAYMTGQALAATWRPMWQAVPYTILLGLSNRFLDFALFEGTLLSVSGFIIDTAVLMVICLVVYRAKRVQKMIEQYPWLYERAGLLNFRESTAGR